MNPKAGLSELAKLVNKSVSTVRRTINKSTAIRRIGADKGGYWEVIE